MADDDQQMGGQSADGQGAPPAAAGLADMLKRAFAEYVREHDVLPREGEQQLNLDLDFVRDHGGPLVAHMLKDLTRSLLPDNLNFSVPADKTAPEGEAGGGVAINFDLKDFLGKLLQPPQAHDDGAER